MPLYAFVLRVHYFGKVIIFVYIYSEIYHVPMNCHRPLNCIMLERITYVWTVIYGAFNFLRNVYYAFHRFQNLDRILFDLWLG